MRMRVRARVFLSSRENKVLIYGVDLPATRGRPGRRDEDK
jgi:hypothetical protein